MMAAIMRWKADKTPAADLVPGESLINDDPSLKLMFGGAAVRSCWLASCSAVTLTSDRSFVGKPRFFGGRPSLRPWQQRCRPRRSFP